MNMKNLERTLLTLEKRMELAAKSQAASPETAVKLMHRLSEVPVKRIFYGRTDYDIMYKLTGEFWEHPDVGMDSYQSLIRSFELAISRDNEELWLALPEMSLEKGWNPYRPFWGIRTNNALILLGLILLDHAKGSLRPKDIYYCTRMTLGQYLNALEDLSFRENAEPDLCRVESFRSWKNLFLKDYDGSGSLEEALAGIVRRYIAAWQEFDHLDHILHCMGGLSCYLEQEEAGRTLSREEENGIRRFREALCRYGSDLEGWDLVEPAIRYPDPYGYYFSLAYEYPEDVPDPGSRDVAPGTLRRQIFLSGRDYSPETLRELAARSPSPDLRELLEKYIREERLAYAMEEINAAVADLYMLLVEPYLRMENFQNENKMT